MKVFLDTNILLDFVYKREDYAEEAYKLFALGCMGRIQLITSALSFVTAMYVAHKYNYGGVRDSLLGVSKFVRIIDLKAQTVVDMLSSEWKDYEDATQNHSAVLAMADCIVTRNKKDFKLSELPVYSVGELFARL